MIQFRSSKQGPADKPVERSIVSFTRMGNRVPGYLRQGPAGACQLLSCMSPFRVSCLPFAARVCAPGFSFALCASFARVALVSCVTLGSAWMRLSFVPFSCVVASACFWSCTDPEPQRKVCAVTGMPAKYFDPLTNSPYATQAVRARVPLFVSLAICSLLGPLHCAACCRHLVPVHFCLPLPGFTHAPAARVVVSAIARPLTAFVIGLRSLPELCTQAFRALRLIYEANQEQLRMNMVRGVASSLPTSIGRGSRDCLRLSWAMPSGRLCCVCRACVDSATCCGGGALQSSPHFRR